MRNNKIAKAGVTAAAALGLVLGTAVTATATTTGEPPVGITPFRGGWVDCGGGRGMPAATGILAVQGWMRVIAGGDGVDFEGPRGTSGTAVNSRTTAVNWSAMGNEGDAFGHCV